MESQSDGSVTHWLEGLQRGDSLAAQDLWNRYFEQLVSVARLRLKNISAETGGEDVALSAMKSVMVGLHDGRFPDLVDRTGLWPLLVTITARKSIDEIRRHTAAGRDASRVERASDLSTIVGQEPSPEFAAEVADQLEWLVRRFDDTTLRIVAEYKLQGWTNDEIADELSVSVRTVIRKLNRIRQEWEETVDSEPS